MDAFARWLDLARPHGVDTRMLSRRETEALLPNAAGWVGALHTRRMPWPSPSSPYLSSPAQQRRQA